MNCTQATKMIKAIEAKPYMIVVGVGDLAKNFEIINVELVVDLHDGDTIIFYDDNELTYEYDSNEMIKVLA